MHSDAVISSIFLIFFVSSPAQTAYLGWTGICYLDLLSCNGITLGFNVPGLRSCARECNCLGYARGRCATSHGAHLCHHSHPWVCLCHGIQRRHRTKNCWLKMIQVIIGQKYQKEIYLLGIKRQTEIW